MRDGQQNDLEKKSKPKARISIHELRTGDKNKRLFCPRCTSGRFYPRDFATGRRICKWCTTKKKERDHANRLSRQRPQTALRKAIKDGVLRKGTQCVVCSRGGEHLPARRILAHHCDYSKPLDVMWLCGTHHNAWHRVFEAEGQYEAERIK